MKNLKKVYSDHITELGIIELTDEQSKAIEEITGIARLIQFYVWIDKANNVVAFYEKVKEDWDGAMEDWEDTVENEPVL